MDNNNLLHTIWNCEYHIVLHQNTEENYIWRVETGYGKYPEHAV